MKLKINKRGIKSTLILIGIGLILPWGFLLMLWDMIADYDKDVAFLLNIIEAQSRRIKELEDMVREYQNRELQEIMRELDMAELRISAIAGLGLDDYLYEEDDN